MTSVNFCYWLQGFLELNPNLETIDKEQIALIRKHVNLVFIHEIDPSYGDAEHLQHLNQVHNAPTLVSPAGPVTTTRPFHGGDALARC